MHVISIYNNKGGVGKSTLTVCLAEFLRTLFDKHVLVIDLDGQASSSCSLLGKRLLVDSIAAGKTIGHLVKKTLESRRIPDLSPFIVARPASSGRGSVLQELSVLIPDKELMYDLESNMTEKEILRLRTLLRAAFENEFDFVLIDMPSHVFKGDRLVVAGMLASDFVVIPTEPSKMALTALPDTIRFIDYARQVGKSNKPHILGIICNKTDKREEQYRSKFPAILAAAINGELPPIFENILPDTPKLETATDDSIDFVTLKEKFDTYYDNVRKVARELFKRCEDFEPSEEAPLQNAAGFLAGLLMGFKRNKRTGQTKAKA